MLGVNEELLEVTRVNGHAVIANKNLLYCPKCEESIEAEQDSPIERLNAYGQFHNIECEKWAETFK